MNKQAPSFARIMTMVLFALSCFGLLVFLWVAFGGATPLRPDGYQITVPFKEAGQLAQQADVRISGVRVGTVKTIVTDPESGNSNVTVEMLPQYSPVASDSRAMLRAKSLLGETYLELTPGSPDGPFVADNGTLPRGNIKPSVELDEIFRAFDPKTREAFGTWQQQLAITGTGQGRDLNDAFAQLAPLEEQAASLGKVLNRNQLALSGLVRDTGVVFSALSARGDQLASLIVNSNRVFSTTAAANQQLADTFVALPTFQRESRETLDRLVVFADTTNPLITQLQPVAKQLAPTAAALEETAPALNDLFIGLGPAISAAKKGLPATDVFLAETPPLLQAIDPLAANLNPLFQYVGQYPSELTAFIANTAAATNARTDLNGKAARYLRVTNTLNPRSLASYPERVKSSRSNPYPLPRAFDKLATANMPVFQTTPCTSGITAGLSASAEAALGSDYAARVKGYAFNTNNPDGIGDPANVVAPACTLQGPVFGSGFYFPQFNAGVVTPKLVP
jgi:virulence factor Mce-like protein